MTQKMASRHWFFLVVIPSSSTLLNFKRGDEEVIMAQYSPLKVSPPSPPFPASPRRRVVSFSPWGTLVNVPALFLMAAIFLSAFPESLKVTG